MYINRCASKHPKLLGLLLIATVTLNLVACGRDLDWIQDAPLHDGRVLVVERHSGFDPGTPNFVLTGNTISDYNTWGCPNPPYLVYRYEQGKWAHLV